MQQLSFTYLSRILNISCTEFFLISEEMGKWYSWTSAVLFLILSPKAKDDGSDNIKFMLDGQAKLETLHRKLCFLSNRKMILKHVLFSIK